MILVSGASGLIGGALIARLRREGRVVLATMRKGSASTDSIPLDLCTPKSWNIPQGIQVAILCAWSGGVTEAAQNPCLARRTNIDGTLALVSQLKNSGTKIVFLSTSLVFAGEPTLVDAPVSPCCEYGRQKATVEKSLDLAVDAVVRITKVGDTLLPRLKQWGQALRRGECIAASAQLRVAPVMIQEVTEALAEFAMNFHPGMYHMSARQDFSYHEIALAMAETCGRETKDVQKDSGSYLNVFSPVPASGGLGIYAPSSAQNWPLGVNHMTRLVAEALS